MAIGQRGPGWLLAVSMASPGTASNGTLLRFPERAHRKPRSGARPAGAGCGCRPARSGLLVQLLNYPVDHHGQQAAGCAQKQTDPCFLSHHLPFGGGVSDALRLPGRRPPKREMCRLARLIFTSVTGTEPRRSCGCQPAQRGNRRSDAAPAPGTETGSCPEARRARLLIVPRGRCVAEPTQVPGSPPGTWYLGPTGPGIGADNGCRSTSRTPGRGIRRGRGQ